MRAFVLISLFVVCFATELTSGADNIISGNSATNGVNGKIYRVPPEAFRSWAEFALALSTLNSKGASSVEELFYGPRSELVDNLQLAEFISREGERLREVYDGLDENISRSEARKQMSALADEYFDAVTATSESGEAATDYKKGTRALETVVLLAVKYSESHSPSFRGLRFANYFGDAGMVVAALGASLDSGKLFAGGMGAMIIGASLSPEGFGAKIRTYFQDKYRRRIRKGLFEDFTRRLDARGISTTEATIAGLVVELNRTRVLGRCQKLFEESSLKGVISPDRS